MGNVIKRDKSMERLYSQMEESIRKLVGAFVRRYKFANFYTDFLGEASLTFVSAFADYDGRMELEKYIRVKIWNRLVDIQRQKAIQNVQCARAYPELESLPDNSSHPEFDIDKFTKNMTQDARTVVEVVFDVIDRPVICKRIEGSKRKSLSDFLKTMGWPNLRIQNAFLEIEGVLANASGN